MLGGMNSECQVQQYRKVTIRMEGQTGKINRLYYLSVFPDGIGLSTAVWGQRGQGCTLPSDPLHKTQQPLLPVTGPGDSMWCP